jgi:hypothetical protein
MSSLLLLPSLHNPTLRQVVLYGTAVGSAGMLLPPPIHAGAGESEGSAASEEAALRVLRLLQGELVGAMQHAAGLNPAAFRRRFAKVPKSMQGGQSFVKQLTLEQQGRCPRSRASLPAGLGCLHARSHTGAVMGLSAGSG